MMQCTAYLNPDYVEENMFIVNEPQKPIKPQRKSALYCLRRLACHKAAGTPTSTSLTCKAKEGCGHQEKAQQHEKNQDFHVFLVSMEIFLSGLLELSEQYFVFRKCLGTISE